MTTEQEQEPYTRELAIDRIDSPRDLWKAVAMEYLGWPATKYSGPDVPDDPPAWIEEPDTFSPYFNLEDALLLAEYVGEENSLEVRLTTVSLNRQRVEVVDLGGQTLRTFRGSEPIVLVLRAVLFASRITERSEW